MRIEYTSGYYIGDVNYNDEPHGRGKFVYDNGDTYEGEWHNGERHGRGKYVWDDGTYYDGEWRMSEQFGSCRKWTFDAIRENYYTGSVAYGKFNGQGKYVWDTGDTYEGEWYNGNMQGYGKYVYANGNYYVGNFSDDQYCGKGTWYQEHGAVSYEGTWINNENATDVTENDHGKKRHGKMVNDCFEADPLNGYAREDYDNGYYEGNFSNGKRHGRGKYVWSNGNEYDGYWQYGDMHGSGRLKYRDSDIWDVYDGMWSHDEWDGRGYLVHLCGDSYQGYFKEGQYCGQGVFTYKDGTKLEGKWSSCGYADPITLFKEGEQPQKGKLIDWDFIPERTNTSSYSRTNMPKTDGVPVKHQTQEEIARTDEKPRQTQKQQSGNLRNDSGKADLVKQDHSAIEKYLRTKRKLDADQIEQELRRFENHSDIGAELSDALKTGKFPEKNPICVCIGGINYTASMLYKKHYARTIYGAYRRLAQLRERPGFIKSLKKKAGDQ